MKHFWLAMVKNGFAQSGLAGLHKLGLMINKNLYTVLIPLCKNNLNLPLRSSFFLSTAWQTNGKNSLIGYKYLPLNSQNRS